MTFEKEESHLWWFDSHNISRSSPWLQSTLSKLEEMTKGMLKLIEGDADTFAQRAEMYYKKRPELISKIEDFYRSYRSLAVRHEQLKLESGNSSLDKGWLNKEWSVTDKSCESSSIMSDSEESEVEDPELEIKFREVPTSRSDNGLVSLMQGLKESAKHDMSVVSIDSNDSEEPEVEDPEPEEYQLEIEFREEPTLRMDNDLVSLMSEKGAEKLKENDISDVSVDSDDSGLSEIFHFDIEEAEVESKLQEVSQKKSDDAKVTVTSTEDELFEYSEVVHGELEEVQNENNSRRFREKEREGKAQSIRMIEEKKDGSDLAKLTAELERLKEENENLKAELAKKDEGKRVSGEREDKAQSIRMIEEKKGDCDLAKLTRELERLKEENKILKAELAKKDEDNLREFQENEREGKAQSIRMIEEKKGDSELAKLTRELERLKEENGNLKAELAKKDEDNSIEFQEKEREDKAQSIRMIEEKKGDSDLAKLTRELERLKEENENLKAELAKKDEEKREVIRQLSMSMDMLKEENDSMKKFIKEHKKWVGLSSDFKKLKEVFSGKKLKSYFGSKTTLVAL